MWDLVLQPGIDTGPLHWERRVLATGPPGKFQASYIWLIVCTLRQEEASDHQTLLGQSVAERDSELLESYLKVGFAFSVAWPLKVCGNLNSLGNEDLFCCPPFTMYSCPVEVRFGGALHVGC